MSKLKDKERDEAEDLLPWYVAGTLDAAGRRRVEIWLRETPDAGRRLEIVRAEQEAAIAAGEARGAPAPGALDRLMKALPERAGSRTYAPKAGWRSGLLAGLLAGPGLRWAAAAAVLLVMLQAAALTYVVTRDGGSTYQSASGGGQTVAGGTRVLVRFSETASAKDISELLETAGMEIVGGPKPGGVYVVRLSGSELGEAERDAAMAKLRAGGIVTFVAPAE